MHPSLCSRFVPVRRKWRCYLLYRATRRNKIKQMAWLLTPDENSLTPIHDSVRVKGKNTSRWGRHLLRFLKYTVFFLRSLFLQPAESNCHASSAWIPSIKNHVTPFLLKLWKPKSDCIQPWIVGDVLKAFQFPKPWSEWNVLTPSTSQFRIQL